MIAAIRTVTLLTYLILGVAGFFFVSPAVSAQTNVLSPACQSAPDSDLCRQNDVETKPGSNPIYGPNGIITKAANLVSILIAIAAIVTIIVSGLQYVLSTGDSAKVNQAKNAILYALIGLAVAALAQVIIVFVIRRL